MQKYICYKNGVKSLNFSWTGSHKILRKCFVLCLEMTGRVFLFELFSFWTSLTLFKKIEKCLWIRFVCPSACASSNSFFILLPALLFYLPTKYFEQRSHRILPGFKLITDSLLTRRLQIISFNCGRSSTSPYLHAHIIEWKIICQWRKYMFIILNLIKGTAGF